MRDIVITARTLRRELFILLGCTLAACLVNLGAIIAYARPARELVTMIGYVLALALVLYLLLWVVRLVIRGVRLLVRSLRKGRHAE